MVNGFEEYGFEITTEKQIAACAKCPFCITANNRADTEYTCICEILGKEMSNKEADSKTCKDCPITCRSRAKK